MVKISIIVPVYNVKDYLERCVKSILNQSEKNIEVILVDDGSTDGSALLCDNLAKLDERVISLHKENGGLSSARNYGLQFSKGEHVCFIDSDDVIAPYFVERLNELMEKNGCDIAVGEFVTFSDEPPMFELVEEKVEVVEGKQAINKLFGDSYVSATIACNKMYKKSLFNDIKYPEGLINEDEATAYKLYYIANKVVFSNLIVYGYYMRPNSITKSRFSEKNFDFLKIAWERCLFFKEKNQERYYHLFLKEYCWALLDFSNKAKKILKDKNKNKLIVKEFKKKSKELISSPYITTKKKLMIALIRAFTPLYFLLKKINKKR